MTQTDDEGFSVLLLSGGIDSACLATWLRPNHTLFIDYGQRPAVAEHRAAKAIASEVEIPFSELRIDMSAVGAGLLSGERPLEGAPSPEWWPFRNQLLVSMAAAWALGSPTLSLQEGRPIKILTGTVASDGARHADGTDRFYEALDALLLTQEGHVRVETPAIKLTTSGLVVRSAIRDDVLAWTHSCHRGDLPCQECPGCYKRQQVLTELGRLA